ncbi:hypothetical protein K491DRAFT_4442 [Lophiostoma macrostomum CBS 122681]|uniref:Uncharacterized protein n=1 Tax=Lophiostoma macrostomum CBS 122681 TaxID=1314788 RepID=A0A6A6TSP5_9PLEO|nr:hypothetical protein K491DRAFT_4442 [Lophiostoma macrostomum CBS 122681]
MYSLEWIQNLALDYVAFTQYAAGLSDQDTAEVLQFLVHLVQDVGSGVTKRDTDASIAVRHIIANLLGAKRQYAEIHSIGIVLHELHTAKTKHLQPIRTGPILVPTPPPTSEEAPMSSATASPIPSASALALNFTASRLKGRQLIVPVVQELGPYPWSEAGVDGSIPESTEESDNVASSGTFDAYLKKIRGGVNKGKTAIGKMLSFLTSGTTGDLSSDDTVSNGTAEEETAANPKEHQDDDASSKHGDESQDTSEDPPWDEPISGGDFTDIASSLDDPAAEIDSLLNNENANVPLDGPTPSRGSEEDEVSLNARQEDPSSEDGVAQDDTLSSQDYADFLGAINEASSNLEELIKERFEGFDTDSLANADDGDVDGTSGSGTVLRDLKTATAANLARNPQSPGSSEVGADQNISPSTSQQTTQEPDPITPDDAAASSDNTPVADTSVDPSKIADIIQGIVPGFTAEDLPLPVDVDPATVPVPAGVLNDTTPLADADMDFGDDVASPADAVSVPDSSILDAIAPVGDPDMDFADEGAPSSAPGVSEAGQKMADAVKDTPLDMLEVNGPGSGEMSEDRWTWDKL